MTGIIFKLTNAGRAALVNAAHDGTLARRIVSVGITASAFTPAAELTAIPGEIKRLTTFAGDVVAADTIHLTIRDDGADTYTVRGLGLYLDNGVLLGSYSQSAAILEKSAASIFLLATDLRVLDGSVDISTLQFGDTSFLNPPATTQRQGVVELSTAAEAAALADDTRALTPASVQPLFAARALVSTTITAGTGLTGGGNLGANRTLAVQFGTTASTAAAGNHTHADATTSAAGLMSATDKTKLDGIEAEANKYTLPSASATVLGGIKLGHTTVQTVAAAAPTATASRSYAVQVNATGQAVVNVPWVDTNTTYN
ncbi:head fiber protein, partial [Comamonas nitrativorans]